MVSGFTATVHATYTTLSVDRRRKKKKIAQHRITTVGHFISPKIGTKPQCHP